MRGLSGCFVLLLFVVPGWADELPVGEWTGRYCFAEDDPLQVVYQVEKRELEGERTDWSITMNIAGVAIEFSAVMLQEGALRFLMNPGEEVTCLLNVGEGGIYTGSCRSLVSPEDGQEIRIFMRPPVMEDDSEAVDATPPAISPPDNQP